MATTTVPTSQSDLSPFELLITCNPPILQSLLAQVSTETIFRLYQTSSFLRDFFSKSPTSWRYISWRLSQPAAVAALTANNGGAAAPRQSSNYALDQILLNIINPFSTRLVSLELDNTAVSGATLTSTVLVLRRDTLQHVSVRGCKNVSLKYHINPWLQMHALARESQTANGPPGFEMLALKSLYTYRCRHHRRRPYLPSSLARKESDSEPTHELVLTCHKLGIWTDTAWCTTPGARCYRRRGYVKMRMPQDPREVWVVYDRLWRSRNWLGPIDQSRTPSDAGLRKRKRDCRSWEFDEEGINGEALGLRNEGKATPAHLRESHRQFVENITCQNCSAEILERCEQCSVMMHCVGCRKTLCASCAFDRPYLRNKVASEEERNRFWWAPGCAVSPCSMQDQDLPANGVIIGSQTQPANVLPNIKFRWCCTEPVFSGGGGITFGGSSTRETDRIRAAPLPSGQGWEDPEFSPDRSDLGKLSESAHSHSHETSADGPGGRWSSMDNFFQTVEALSSPGYPPTSVPRVLCDECYSSEHWKLKCEACSTALCLKHDIGDRMKARICGYRDLLAEKQEYRSRQKALKLLATLMRHRKERLGAPSSVRDQDETSSKVTGLAKGVDHLYIHSDLSMSAQECEPGQSSQSSYHVLSAHAAEDGQTVESSQAPLAELDLPLRSLSPASDSTEPPSRSTSPTPSAQSTSATEPGALAYETELPSMPRWQGCQAFFCPATRPPSDHRRRCTAVMKQCLECKVQVCGTCVNAEGPPCPCKGCRGTMQPDDPSSSTGPAMSAYVNAGPADTAPFYCPNCRWERMLTGRCKRKTEEFLRAQSQTLRKMKKRKDKRRKPVYDRQGESSHRSAAEDAIDGLVEFFTSLNTQFSETGHSEEVDAMLALPEVDPHSATNMNDIQELEDMGALARDLIRRIQRLRDQFRPGSLAALALPDIRLEGDLEASTAAVIMPALPVLPLPFQRAPGHAGGQLEIMQENQLMLDQPEMEDDDDDEHLLDGRDSSSE
ncbi:hypothetical protein LTR13_006664 [Exophiala sideris]|nr:hypothetical protein LTR13_006664 [Exophiala sideris]KAK5181006.1 hypothetical protein LTR44_006826 [Eurotiomycetes sp. CCFEE 6388]